MPRRATKRSANPFAAISGARKADFPGLIEPCHPTQHIKAPKGDRWVHEIKVDGYRCELHVLHGTVMAFTRRGYDWANVSAQSLKP